jgi:predicted metalloprotease
MRWTPGGRSSDLEDIRGQSSLGGGGRRGFAMPLTGGGIVIMIVLALLSQVCGVNFLGGGGDPDPTGGGYAQTQGPSTGPSARRAGDQRTTTPGADPEQQEMEFISFVLDDVQKTFEQMFRERGLDYRHAHLVVFTDAVDTGCGESSAAVGPFYCPPDQKAYIDLSFYQELKQRFGAAGDFAEAYVLAHELGHHVQNLMGIDEKFRREMQRSPRSQSELSVRMELQADCFAGVWGHSTQQRQILEAGDVEEAMNAAQAIGDDRLQKMAGRRVNPETWTHGSSAQRAHWFQRGFSSGRFEDCDTFSARDL